MSVSEATSSARSLLLVCCTSSIFSCGSETAPSADAEAHRDAGADGGAAGESSSGGRGAGGAGGTHRDGGPAEARASGGAAGSAGAGGARDASVPIADGGGRSSSDASAACSDAAAEVCVDIPGTLAAFFDENGTLLRRGRAPIGWVLPPNGSVLASVGVGPALHFDVPPGTTLRAETPATPPPPTDLQDIEINVPAAPDGSAVASATGCMQAGGAKEFVGTGTKVFKMTSACLEGGLAAVLVVARGAYIYVDGIALGADDQKDLAVALPAWKTVSAGVALTLNDVPTGFDAQVSYFVRWGRGELSNITLRFGATGNVTSYLMESALGAEWFRLVQVGTSQPVRAWSIDSRSLGKPPATDTLSARTDLLPLVTNVAVSGRTLSFGYANAATPTGADRVVLYVHGTGPSGAQALRVIASPTRTSITVPLSLPPDLATFTVDTITGADVYVEDLASVNDFPSALARGPALLQFPGGVDDSLGRQSYRASQ